MIESLRQGTILRIDTCPDKRRDKYCGSCIPGFARGISRCKLFLKSFPGGIHLKDYKFLTEDLPIKKAPMPKKVRIPLNQNIGKPAMPIVNIGDFVKTGQLIASLQGPVSANIHSSITGRVTVIDKFPEPVKVRSSMLSNRPWLESQRVGSTLVPTHVGTSTAELVSPGMPGALAAVTGEYICIEIEGNGSDELQLLTTALSYEGAGRAGDVSDIIQRVQSAGIVGMGGAMFPTHVKLQPPKDKKIDTIIINGAECEPFITSDYRLMIERPESIMRGLKIVMQAAGAEKGYIAIESNKPKAIEALKCLKFDLEHFNVVELPAKYPQGGERQLIKAVLNRDVPSGGFPFDVGVIVHNVGTVVAIDEAVTLGKPLYERVVTVTGSCVKEPANWLVRIGTLFSDLIEWSGGLKTDAGKLIMGGPMMGIAQSTFNVPIVKGTSAVLVLNKNEVTEVKKEPCIRCGKCVTGCPMGLDPGRLAVLIEKGRLEEAKELGVMDCIECGVCAYLCPANRDIIRLVKYAKKQLMS